MYSAEEIKSFLQKTKNQHGVKVEDYFPDLSVFYTSARLHMSQREESGLTDQEGFRLKKLVLKHTLQRTLTRDITRSIEDLESDTVELEKMSESTGKRGHIEVLSK
ncbi:hypothetical protein L3Q82_006660 [Scortum barcoo]|uniref:Uncharacterized protein n=1 Tax=Scortum barcoo TaxID=214431 RepID=A0ACB8X002_9TELE|nr:hypothetical protein L3Q82_006660 [Scortum barcoo]